MSVSQVKEKPSKMSKTSKKNENGLIIAFIADDIKNFNEFAFFHNATFALMLAAQDLCGNDGKILLTESKYLKVRDGKVFARFEEVVLKHNLNEYISVNDTSERSFENLDIVFARKDPPIDQSFIAYAQTLLLVSKNTFVVNNPEGILKVNEKLSALNFPNIIPPTLVTSNKAEILDFINHHKEAVIKPLFNKGGEGVFYLNSKINNESAINQSILNENHPALVQKFIPEIKNGDKRIILLNGNPLGAIYRIPKQGEFRANVRHGASIKPCVMSRRDFEICEILKPYLLKNKIYFASIDVISDYLIEVNVTCPASLQEVERCTGRKVAKEIVEWAIESRIIRNNKNLCL